MKNSRKLTTNYIMNTLCKNDLYYFSVKNFSDFFCITRNRTYRLIQSLKSRGLIAEVENGKYLLLGYESEKALSNPFFIASHIVFPSYISFWTALNYYGFTEQAPKMILVATTKQKKETRFRDFNFKYIKRRSYKFFGYTKEVYGDLTFLIADKEKAIIDSLDQSRYAGGILEVAKSLSNAVSEIDTKKIVEYAVKMRNKSLCSRLGFMLEKLGEKEDKLQEFSSNTWVKLEPVEKTSKKYNKKWKLNINIDLKGIEYAY